MFLPLGYPLDVVKEGCLVMPIFVIEKVELFAGTLDAVARNPNVISRVAEGSS